MFVENRKILIIDDEVDICFLLASVLRKKGFEVAFVNSLTEGFSKLSDSSPSLLFLDINLPDGSGLEAIATVKKLSPATKIIMISAFDSLKERNIADEKGADYFLGKPFNKDTAYAAIDSVFGSPAK